MTLSERSDNTESELREELRNQRTAIQALALVVAAELILIVGILVTMYLGGSQ